MSGVSGPRGLWRCPICGARRRGLNWGKQLERPTAFLTWQADYSITATWLEPGACICRGHDSAEQQLERKRKIAAAGDAAHPEALARDIQAIERILEAGPPA